MNLKLVDTAINIILLGPNCVGKLMLTLSLTDSALLKSHRALFITTGKMLDDLRTQHSAAALQRRLRYYARPDVLVIDELDYLPYSDRHADLLFKIVNRDYQKIHRDCDNQTVQ